MKIFLTCCLFVASFVPAAFAQDMPGLKVGAQAPDFIEQDFRGKEIQLSEYYIRGPVILVFYRGSWCPYCSAQLQELQAHLEDFQKHQATLIAVSVDKIDTTAKAAEGFDLTFDIISNPEGDILQLYGLMHQVPDELNKKYKEEYNIDLEAASGRTDHVIAIPATYIIDPNGTIVFAYANEDYKTRPSPEEILQALEEL